METLQALATRLVPPGRRPGVALAQVLTDGTTELAVRPGRWRFDANTPFEIASVTKTMTATLLALLVNRGTVALETTVGDLLGADAGGAADITLEELATHTSGLPRILVSPGAMVRSPRDPYRRFDLAAMRSALRNVVVEDRGTAAYSNAGFALLGHCLGAVAGEPFARVLEREVLRPAGMATARCQPCSDDGLPRGAGSRIIGGRRWHSPLAGDGGVDASIIDLAAWARANLLPDSTSLGDAVRLAQKPRARFDERLDIGLAWLCQGAARTHNGGSGRFSATVLFEPSVGAVAHLENQGPLLRRPARASGPAVNDWFLDWGAAAGAR